MFQSIDENAPPLVTVAMPVYNAGRYLRPAVMSIVAQTFQDWELLILDDGSTDNALDSIADINDKRIRIVQDGHNNGLSIRLNQAIDLARGHFLARMDSDDISYPNRFARQVEVLTINPEIDLLATRCVTISESNDPVGTLPYVCTHEEICSCPWRSFYLPHPTWMGRIEWFRKFRYLIPEPHYCEDQDLLTRSYMSSRFALIPEILFAYRIRTRTNLKKQLKQRASVLRMQVRNFAALHRWHFIPLCLMVFVGRVALELVNALLPARSKIGAHAQKNIDQVEIDRLATVSSITGSKSGFTIQ